MVSDGMSVLLQDAWLIWPPGIAIALTVLAFTFLGDMVRDTMAEGWSTTSGKRQVVRAVQPDDFEPLDVDRSQTLLSVEHLTVAFPSPAGPALVLEDVSFHIGAGEAVGIVGESGCGKTMTAMSILGLLPGGGQIEAGGVYYDGRNLAALPERDLWPLRGQEIALISQEPLVGLTPTYRVGWQIAQLVRRHDGVSRKAAQRRTIELLRQVHLPDPHLVASRYVHELSGGMAQRVAIARALAGEPRLLIADEPTTALDVTVQAEILDLLRELQVERKMAILLITHDWGVIADICDRAIVMYAGEVVEQADLTAIFGQPRHPYTEALLASNPHHASESERLPSIPGAVPRPGAWPVGCHFAPRCGYETAACRAATVPLARLRAGRLTRCLHHEQLVADGAPRTLVSSE
jgi:peptide/nickel transport system permease protein